jgi:hypothetical protein
MVILVGFKRASTDMRRLTTEIRYEKWDVRRFRRCANVCLHKPSWSIYSLLLLGYKPVQHVTVLNAVGNCAVLNRLATPSSFHIPLPSTVPFSHSETSFTHGCTYPIFPGSSGTISFLPSFRFPVDHNFWQSHWVHSLNMSKPNELFSGYVIQ